jgi:hypothetical protein
VPEAATATIASVRATVTLLSMFVLLASRNARRVSNRRYQTGRTLP